MSDQQYNPQGYGQQGYGQQQYGGMPAQQGGYAPMPAGQGMTGGMPPSGPIGQQRSTGMCILLTIVTFGIYNLVWNYKTFEEMKRHTGEGLGGGLGLVLSIFVGFVTPFLHSGEVARLYERRGQQPPVTSMTGLWVLPGFLIIVGPIIWFVKENQALNEYWASLGAPPA